MHQLRALVLTLLAGLLATIGVLASGPTAVAADGTGDGDVAWAVRTASNKYGEGRQNYRYTLDPGGTLRDALVVTNHGKQPLTLAVYAADGFTTGGGQLDLLTTDTESTGVGLWVRPGQKSVTIGPEKSVEVPFTLTLPDNATPGDHMGGIITSLTQPGTAQINVDRRLAIRIQLRVGGDLDPVLSVDDPKISPSGTLNPFGRGGATVDYTVRNTGNAILSARQSVSVSGPFGLLESEAGDIPDTPQLLPGESWKVSVPVDDVATAVRLAATVHLTPLLQDASGSTSTLPQVEETTHAWAIPWVLLVVVLLVVAAIVVAVVLRRRRRDQARDREDARVQQAVAEALRGRETTDV